MYHNLKKKPFIVIFSTLLLLTPLFYYIFSMIVIIDCTRTKVIKYLIYPIYNIYKPNKMAFCELTYSKNYELIFFSDSTNNGKLDVTTKEISEYLEKNIKKKILSVDLGGGNANIYSDFVDYSYFINYSKINYAILTLNLRIFSEQSYTFLEFYQNKQRYFSRVFYEPYKIINFIKLNNLIFNPKITENKTLDWKKREVTINHIKFNLGENTNKEQTKIEAYFKTYMGKIKKNHPILLSIINLNEKLKSLGIKLIVYSTPINITEAKQEFNINNQYLINDKQFEERIFDNIKIIEEKLYTHNIPFLDLTLKIKDLKIFYDRNYNFTAEHINYIGRKFVAKELQKFIDIY